MTSTLVWAGGIFLGVVWLMCTALVSCAIAEVVVRLAARLYTSDPTVRGELIEEWVGTLSEMTASERPQHAATLLWAGLRRRVGAGLPTAIKRRKERVRVSNLAALADWSRAWAMVEWSQALRGMELDLGPVPGPWIRRWWRARFMVLPRSFDRALHQIAESGSVPEDQLDAFEQFVENLRARGWASYRCPPRQVMLYNRWCFKGLRFKTGSRGRSV